MATVRTTIELGEYTERHIQDFLMLYFRPVNDHVWNIFHVGAASEDDIRRLINDLNTRGVMESYIRVHADSFGYALTEGILNVSIHWMQCFWLVFRRIDEMWGEEAVFDTVKRFVAGDVDVRFLANLAVAFDGCPMYDDSQRERDKESVTSDSLKLSTNTQ